MYGASGKIGRGGGGGGSGGKRVVHAPPIGRPTPAGRVSMGGGPRGRGGPSSGAASSPLNSSVQVEESFSLVRENPLNFGMAIRLAPDLVEEIKRVEAYGCKARIKFGAIAGENVIQVGDKTFKFTWSREPRDLCDIYEECRGGDGGNGLLVESGGTWRKLNVERELDESTKNHVKKLSEEAERKLKSRKAIVLDHQNSAMKNQMKAFAASESNQWRNSKNRKEPPSKKLKTGPTSGGPPKSFYKSGLPSSTLSKGRLSAGSPLSSQPEHLGPSTSPIGSGDLVKEHIGISDFAASQNLNKVLSSEKDIANRRNSAISDKFKHNQNTEAKPADLRSLLISLLLEHQSAGMSLKALEKAVGDAMPNSTWKIEPVLKQIANYQAPGRYHLKPGIEMESFKKLPQSGSSPETNRDHLTALPKVDQMHAQDPSIPLRTSANDEEQGELNPAPAHTADITEKIDTVRNSPENLSDRNASHRGEGMAGSSSDSGSDTDSQSNSSDSGSDSDSGSHSKNKSQSPAGSRGGSSSESDSDASSSSKQASDEEVDIMSSDDEKESKLNLDNGHVDIGNSENQDHHVSDSIEIDIEKDFDSDDHGAEIVAPNHLFANKESEEPTEDIKPSSADDYEEQERRAYEKKAYDDGSDSMVNDSFEHGQSGNHGKSSKMNSKRRFDDMHSGERTHIKKRSNSKTSIEPVSGTINSLFGDSPYNSSPDRPLQSPDKQPIDLMGDRGTRSETSYPDLQTGPSHPAQRSSEARMWTEAPPGEKRPGKSNGLDRGVKYSERSLQSIEGLQIQKGVEDKHATILESHNRKSETTGVVKEAGPGSNSYRGYSPKEKNSNTADRSLLMNGQSGVLRREHSDLELGEFREPFHEETLISNKQFERKSSFKHLENKQLDADYWNSDSGAKTSNKNSVDLGKLSPSTSDVTRPHHINTRPPKAGTGWSASAEAYGETSQKTPANSTEEQNGPVRGDPSATKHSKKQKPSKTGVTKGRRIDPLTGRGESCQKRILSFADDTSCPFTKFEKEEPELKGPVRDISQYKEYVKEYQEKYESYCSLNKILESYRDEFSKLGNALETCKGRDMKRYNDLLGQMRTSFRQCAEKHKRQKHIFVVLHEELKHLKQMIKDYAAKKG